MADASLMVTVEYAVERRDVMNELKKCELENVKLLFQRDLMILLFGIACVVVLAIV